MHLRCYGLDPEIMDSSENQFHCDICLHMRRRKEFEEIQCFICKRKGEGMMKVETDFKPFIDPAIGSNKSFKSETVWYHPFCAFTNPNMAISNLTSMQGLQMKKDITNYIYETKKCLSCKHEDYVYFLWGSGDYNYHPLCAWLEGYRFEVLRLPSHTVPILPLQFSL